MSNLLTEKQLCDVLHVGRVFLYMCRDRGMPYVRLGAKLADFRQRFAIPDLSDRIVRVAQINVFKL